MKIDFSVASSIRILYQAWQLVNFLSNVQKHKTSTQIHKVVISFFPALHKLQSQKRDIFCHRDFCPIFNFPFGSNDLPHREQHA